MPSPKAVLFDLDDTLISRKKMFEPFSEAFVRDLFPEATELRRAELLRVLRKLDDDGNARRPELFYRLCEQTGTALPAVQDMIAYWNTRFPQFMVVENGVHALLRMLREKGVKLALVTNGDSVLQNGKIDAARLRDCFDAIVVSGDYPFEKPDRRIFALALGKLGVGAKEALFVGDNLINDIHGAQQAGIAGVWINFEARGNTTGVKPSLTLSSVSQLSQNAVEW